MFIDLTIDNEQMMVVYGENEEANVKINMIDTCMINSVIKVFNFKHKAFNEFSVIQYRFIYYKCKFECVCLKTNILNWYFIHLNCANSKKTPNLTIYFYFLLNPEQKIKRTKKIYASSFT